MPIINEVVPNPHSHGKNGKEHSCSGVRGKTKPYSLVLEVISEVRNIFLYTSKRFPKKPNSLQSDISIFSGNTDNSSLDTRHIWFRLT